MTLPGRPVLPLCCAEAYGDRYGCVIWPGDMDAAFALPRTDKDSGLRNTVVGVGGLPATVIRINARPLRVIRFRH